MKKLLYLLIALPLLALGACHNDDDNHPDVNIGFTYSGITEVDGTFYAVKGDTIDIDSVFVNPVNPSQKAAIGAVNYVFDGQPLGMVPAPPFAFSLLSEPMPLGNHTLRLQMTVFQEGKTASIAWLTVPLAVVADSADIPSTPAPRSVSGPSTFSGSARIQQ